jgi:spore coat protein JB
MYYDKLALLKQLQALEFAAVEFNLYLDTHPNDQRALAEYNRIVQQIDVVKKQYECYFGPLFNFGMSPSGSPWRWIEEPWPWEIEY